MKVVYYLWILLIAACSIDALHAGQPPAEEKRGSQDRPQGVPLDKLPVPENGVIVVTPDLKKALDVMGAGSVVLSAERYLELMNKAEKTKADKPNTEMLFAKCLITGEVNQVAGREFADLVFDLEFRTETPNAVVPIPFKGIRISSASLNGQPPIWGPEPDKWTLIIKEPQACRLKLSTSVPITRVGQEKRLTLERVPASAITSLELTVPGKIPSAMVLGYGSVTVAPVDPGKTRFTAPALGVLSSLELTWQTGEAANAAVPASVEGDIRMTLEEAQALVEARFKPVPFAPIQLPWKVRLPKNSQQVRAELARSETGGAESLVVTRQADGTYVLATPYAVSMSQFTQVVIRWRQPLPEADSAEPILLGSCELIEPTGKHQAGTLQLVMPEEQTVFLKPFKLTSADRNFLLTERENRRNPRYRYTQQPAGLEATSLPRAQTRGLVEARLLHTLGVQERSWFLNTDIEIVRSNRANLSQLELDWPAEWQVSRKLLFSPAVKEIEQDTKAERLRIILDGRQPASFTLKLESVSASSLNQVSLRLPQLLSAQGLRNERPTPLDVIIQQERLRLEARGWDLQVVAPGMTGLRDDAGEGNQRIDTSLYVVTGHPAQLTLLRQPRLPKWTSKVEAYVGKDLLQTRQNIQVHAQGSLPRQLTMLVPRSVKAVLFTRLAADHRSSEVLHSSALPADESNPFKKYAVDLPITTEKSITLLCQCEQEASHPITVPFVRLDESAAILEGTATVQCFYEAGLKLSVPAELPGWKVEKQEAGTLELQGESLNPLLVLDRVEDANEATRQSIKNIVERVEQEGASFLVEQETEFGELRQTTLRLNITADRASMTLLGWKLDARSMPESQMKWNEANGITTLTFILPPERLFSPVKVTVALRLKREGMSYLSQLPGMRWNAGSGKEIIPVTWHLQSDPAVWLWWASERTKESRYATDGWLPTTPERAINSTSDTSFDLQGLSSSASLRWLAIPRSLSVLGLSGLALILMRVMHQKPAAAQRLALLLLGLLLILFVLSPGLAAVLFWGAMPGVLIGLALTWFMKQRLKEPRRVPVFQTTGIVSSSSLHSLKPSGSVTEAPTIITSSPQRLR
ncbi:MAG TPA: hypothetical protein PLN21_09680 [Gemmatales bacterium]|nr:hypothetical protein [Gemmatales bacterium]